MANGFPVAPTMDSQPQSFATARPASGGACSSSPSAQRPWPPPPGGPPARRRRRRWTPAPRPGLPPRRSSRHSGGGRISSPWPLWCTAFWKAHVAPANAGCGWRHARHTPRPRRGGGAHLGAHLPRRLRLLAAPEALRPDLPGGCPGGAPGASGPLLPANNYRAGRYLTDACTRPELRGRDASFPVANGNSPSPTSSTAHRLPIGPGCLQR